MNQHRMDDGNTTGVLARIMRPVLAALLVVLPCGFAACSSSDSSGPTPQHALAEAGAPCSVSGDCVGSLRCVMGKCTDAIAGGTGGAAAGTGGTGGGAAGMGGTGGACGDGKCDSSETCESCPSDCGGCTCTACTLATDCPAGTQCLTRTCDGLTGCYANGPDAKCATIGGTACPPVDVYGACNASSDCGPNGCLTDKTKPGSPKVCSRMCNSAADCPQVVPSGSGLTVACVSNAPPNVSCVPETGQPPSTCYICVIKCSSGATCPAGVLCNGC